MLACNTALNVMGYNVAGQGEDYKTQADRLLQDYGCEYTPQATPIKVIEASVDPSKIIEYPECLGAEDKDAIMPVMFKAEQNLKQSDPLAVLKAQAGLIATRTWNAQCKDNFWKS